MDQSVTAAPWSRRAPRALPLPAAMLDQVWLAAPVAAAALAGGFLPAEAIDLWWVLLLGVAPTGAPDPIVFTPLSGPTANVQWLAQRLFAWLYAIGGLELLLLLRASLLALTIGLVEATALRSGAAPRQAALAAWLTLPTVLAGGALRPQLLALPLFGLTLLLGGPLLGNRASRFGVALVVATWANLHGSFVLAPATLVLLAVGSDRTEAAERLRLALIALAAPLLNPWGHGVYAAVLDVTRSNGGPASLGLEWRPLDLTSLVGISFLLQLTAAAVGLRRMPTHYRASAVALLLPLGLMAAAGGRHTVWFAAAASRPAAYAFGEPRRASGRPSVAGAALLLLLAALSLAGLSRPLFVRDQLLAPDTPVAIAEQLALTRARHVFAFSDWAGYLAWQTRPEGRLYIDNRFEQHPPEVWATYRQISLALPGWQDALAELPVDALALEPRLQAPLVAALADSPDWELRHADERGVLYVRR